jgi:hypothetical protein
LTIKQFGVPPIVVGLMTRLGADRIAIYNEQVRCPVTGQWKGKYFPHLIHFFSPTGVEVGYWSNIAPNNPQLFQPHRTWDERFKEAYMFLPIGPEQENA